MTDLIKPEPEFPGQWAHSDGQIESWLGMGLRDYFAAKAMQALLHNASYESDSWHMEAKAAYAIADAMLAERAK